MSKGMELRDLPFMAPVMASAWQTRPGSLHMSRRSDVRRLYSITWSPVVGCKALISTALPAGVTPHTAFKHQWTPYGR
jgi:hypothetical protein